MCRNKFLIESVTMLNTIHKAGLFIFGCGLLMLALSGRAQQASALAQIKEKGVLRVAVYKDNYPYSYLEQGQMRGIDVDLARALAKHLGLGMSTMNLTASDESMSDDLRNAVWKGHYLGGGTADVMMHVPVDKEFAQENDQVLIFAPYYREEMLIAHDHTRVPDVSSLLVFIKEPIGVELATFADTFLSMAERGRLVSKLRHYANFRLACQALKEGEIAAVLAQRAQLEACFKDDSEQFRLSMVPTPVKLLSWPVGMAVKENAADLKNALSDALSELKRSGTLAALFEAHGVTYVEPPPIE